MWQRITWVPYNFPRIWEISPGLCKQHVLSLSLSPQNTPPSGDQHRETELATELVFVKKQKQENTEYGTPWVEVFTRIQKSYFLIKKTTYQVPLQLSCFLDKIFLGAFLVGSLTKRKKVLFRKLRALAVSSMLYNLKKPCPMGKIVSNCITDITQY